jgi:hypothetical protein
MPVLGSTAQGHYSDEAQPLLGLHPTHNAPYKRICVHFLVLKFNLSTNFSQFTSEIAGVQ